MVRQKHFISLVVSSLLDLRVSWYHLQLLEFNLFAWCWQATDILLVHWSL